jgi:hypothetical protein
LDIIRDINKYTSVQIINAIASNDRESRRNELLTVFELEGKFNPNNKAYQFWQHHNHPIEWIQQKSFHSEWITFIITLWKRELCFRRSIIFIVARRVMRG